MLVYQYILFVMCGDVMNGVMIKIKKYIELSVDWSHKV